MMLNQVPRRLGLKLSTSFELVHTAKPNSNTWFELFYIRYFKHNTDNDESRSKLQARTLDIIAVGRDDRSNYIIFYNPITSSYYGPPVCQLNESILPITNFPNSLRFHNGLTCGLLKKKTKPINDPFPPGTHVSIQPDDALACGTIKNIPIPVSTILNCATLPSTAQ